MAKNLKLNIKNTQLAQALNLNELKGKLAAKMQESRAAARPQQERPSVSEEAKPMRPSLKPTEESQPRAAAGEEEEVVRIKARNKSTASTAPHRQAEPFAPRAAQKPLPFATDWRLKGGQSPAGGGTAAQPPRPRLGFTGRHVNDLLRAKPAAPAPRSSHADSSRRAAGGPSPLRPRADLNKQVPLPVKEGAPPRREDEGAHKKVVVKKEGEVKTFKKPSLVKGFDGRDRQGLRSDEEERWRKRRAFKSSLLDKESQTVRPTELKVRIPIAIKDLAAQMKLKASQLISKLFMQGVVVTLNDVLDDPTTIELLGQEFGCQIAIDTSQEERIRITSESIQEEIQRTDAERLQLRPPVVAFMGHVDHGKTSLIDAIRESQLAAGEAGAITQHIGAFCCQTPVGPLTILDTPGHEAFKEMRSRGAQATDIVVLVIAGDEGMKEQTVEALQQAREAGVTIVVALNKCDKPGFNPENVYQQMATNELLPEAWGGTTVTVPCSAVTKQGITELLEMLALQAEVLELKADPEARARGIVLESELHKGMGVVATLLVKNGTLHLGDALVFDEFWGKVKTMRDEFGRQLKNAGPSTAVEVTGLSGLPHAGHEFIVVANEKEAKEISLERQEALRTEALQKKKKLSMEHLVLQAASKEKKVANCILRADVQGSLEALKTSLAKINSSKIDLNVISADVGEVSESDIQLAAASNAFIVGFHTHVESHAEPLIKELGVKVRLHSIIYHAIDDVKQLLVEKLDKVPQERLLGEALVQATFKASQLGVIAGCIVTDGVVARGQKIRILRNGETVWTGNIASLRRVKEDVREVKKGLECGIVLEGFQGVQEGDRVETFEIHYLTQEL